MKVVLADILSELTKAIDDAKNRNRQVAYIELSPSEWNEFVLRMNDAGVYPTAGAIVAYWDGVTIKKELPRE